jgi:D-glycero-D-manno-heptose 1,7-bisphosphate phosphatase
MKLQFADAGAPLAGVYFCPHHPLHAQGAYRIDCECRKPAPGMLLQAARELRLDLKRSVMFGDRRDDMEAARAAGVRRRVLLGKDGRHLPVALDGDLAGARYRSLAEAVASPSLWTLLGENSHA